MTVEKLADQLDELKPAFESSSKSLEEYWRSMYPLALKHKDKIPTLDLFLELIKDAIDYPSLALNPDWLNSAAPPSSNLFEKEANDGGHELKSDHPDFEFFLKVLEFQIAELHKMKHKQLKNEYKHFGIDSETGNRWFNFEPMSILESGLSGIEAHGISKDLKSWIFLGEIIEMGRIYE